MDGVYGRRADLEHLVWSQCNRLYIADVLSILTHRGKFFLLDFLNIT